MDLLVTPTSFPCADCKETLPSHDLLARHKSRVHYTATICNFCYDTFRDEFEAGRHLRRMHVREDGSLEEHLSKELKIDMSNLLSITECPHCSLEVQESNLSAHIKIMHVVKGKGRKKVKTSIISTAEKAKMLNRELLIKCSHCRVELPASKMGEHVKRRHPDKIAEEPEVVPPTPQEQIEEDEPIIELPANAEVKDGNFRCNKCAELFSYDLLLRQHLAVVHYNRAPTRCHAVGPACKCKVKSPSLILRHIMTGHLRHIVAPLTHLKLCKHCPHLAPFNKKEREKEFQISHYISYHFDQIKEIKQFYDRHFQRGQFSCRHCPETFYFEELLNQHIVSIHECKPNTCAHCDEKLAIHLVLPHVMSTHMRQHTEALGRHLGSSIRGCPVCHKSMIHQIPTVKHMMTAHEKEAFTYTIEYPVANTEALVKLMHDNEHVVNVMNKLLSAKEFNVDMEKCSKCDQEFYLKEFLKQHVAITHNGLNALECHVMEGKTCDVPVTNLLMEKHILLEHKLPLASYIDALTHCLHCPLTFEMSQRSNNVAMQHYIKNHMHKLVEIDFDLQERPYRASYSCNHCPASFFFEELFKQHEMTVHGEPEEDEKCAICSAYYSGHALVHHLIMTHMRHVLSSLLEIFQVLGVTDECPTCEKGLKHEGGLAKHMIVYHEEQAFNAVKKSKEIQSGKKVIVPLKAVESTEVQNEDDMDTQNIEGVEDKSLDVQNEPTESQSQENMDTQNKEEVEEKSSDVQNEPTMQIDGSIEEDKSFEEDSDDEDRLQLESTSEEEENVVDSDEGKELY